MRRHAERRRRRACARQRCPGRDLLTLYLIMCTLGRRRREGQFP